MKKTVLGIIFILSFSSFAQSSGRSCTSSEFDVNGRCFRIGMVAMPRPADGICHKDYVGVKNNCLNRVVFLDGIEREITVESTCEDLNNLDELALQISLDSNSSPAQTHLAIKHLGAISDKKFQLGCNGHESFVDPVMGTH